MSLNKGHISQMEEIWIKVQFRSGNSDLQNQEVCGIKCHHEKFCNKIVNWIKLAQDGTQWRSSSLSVRMFVVTELFSFIVSQVVSDILIYPYQSVSYSSSQGHCHVMGCDGVLDSTVQEDSCGVCGGDNSKCRNITHTFHRKLHRCEFIKRLLM